MTKGGGRGSAPPGMEWAEDPDYDKNDLTEAHIKSAYRMNLASHMGDTDPCKRNCRLNPRCLAQLGEKTWFEMEIDDEEEELELEDELVRQDGLPAGLRNLGNTCYVNSFLQIWFHNTKFRQALYDWDPGEDPEEQDNESILDAEMYEPKSKVASLQVLFTMMQYTKRKYVDPADFICKLGLDPSVQQDAQEFSKLFLSRLEDTLSHQAQVRVKSMIQKQFRGEYAYVTSCLTCKNDSVRPEHFYELDLPLTGNKTLAECLADFLHKEKMTGDERYYCEQCQSKQEAIRCCKLRELPPVLNLQLNRFQYDMQLGRKKKLNSNIQFPEELDMGGYLPEGSPRAVYHLTGVLMHVGPDANHGHYIAHIQELETGNWFKFSDECVVPFQGKIMKLGSDEEAAKKGKKTSKGFQNSNNAYMLVYMLQESLMEIREVEAKAAIQRQAVRRAAVARIQERTRRKAERERRRLEEEEDDDEDEDDEEENGNDVISILEKVTDDEDEDEREEDSKDKDNLPKKVDASNETDGNAKKQEPKTINHKQCLKDNTKNIVEKGEIVNIAKRMNGRRDSDSSVGSQGSAENEDPDYVFSNTRVFPKSFPLHLKTKIDRDNQEFDEEQEERHHSRMAEINEQQNKRRTMILQYKGLRWDSDDEGRMDPDNEDSDEDEDEDESWEFLPLSWLMSYFESPQTAGVIETRHLLCLHSKLDIDKLTEVKLVDSNMAAQLYSDNGEGAGPRLNHEHLCRYCVNNKARLLSLECRMSRDNQFLAQERSPQDGTGFWVGKKSYQRWRLHARTELEDTIVEEVQHWKWQEETRLQAFREDQQRRILEMQKAKLQSIRGRGGFRGRGAPGRAVAGERREHVVEGQAVNHCEHKKQVCEAGVRAGEVNGEVTSDVDLTKDSSLTLTDLQAKLQRMGTNVSVAPAGLGGRHPGGADNNTGISVIKNGESFKLANIAEVKLNFSEDDRTRSNPKPSCAVKPIVQTPPVKPSLAVKPFNVKPPCKLVNGTIDGEPVAKKACVVNGNGDHGEPVVRNGHINGLVNGIDGKNDPEVGDSHGDNPTNSSLERLTNGELDSRTSSRSSSTDSQSSDPKTEDSEVSSQTNKSEGSESVGAKSDTCSDKTSGGSESPDKTSGEESEISLASSAPSTSTTVKSGDSKPSPPHTNKPLKRPNAGHNVVSKSCGIAEETFNSDIKCPHGNLRTEQRFRQLISRAAWHRLRTYFRTPKTFQFGTPVCSECEEETNAATVQKEKWREEANRQKARLGDLFGDKQRPEWSKPTTQRVFLLSSHFVMAWRGFVRGLSGGKSEVREPITDVTNKMLLCEEHGGLLYPPLTDWQNHPDPCVVMVHEEEWREIKDMFKVDLEIRVERTNTSQGPILTSTPGICEICVSNRQEAEAEDRLRYTNQIVFVRRISPDAKIPEHEPDPEFCTSPVPGDNKRLKMVGGESVRRSSRRPRVRGETQFVIHSDMLLRDFKVKLMEVFKVAPYDQNLCINGEYLTETQKTMGQLKVLPGSLIFLRADEPTANAPCPTEDWVVQHPEQGFKGTGLLSS